MMFIIRLISRLPFSVLYLLSDLLFVVSFYVVRYRREMVRMNLKRSFPEKSAQELAQIEQAFFRNLCDYAVETTKLLTITKEELSKRMVFLNSSVVLEKVAAGHSILHLASHQFNWEWVLACGSFAFGTQMEFVYQSVRNKFFDHLSLAIRTRFGAIPIGRREVAREMAKRRNRQRGIAIVADQYPGHENDKKHPASFLNQDTVFFYSTQQIASLTQYYAVYYSVKKKRRGYYEATAVEIGSPPYGRDTTTVVDNYIRAVEKTIREEPEGWLWSHNRWKTRHLNRA